MWKYRETNELYHGEDELYHYGVVGMRWRYRKAQMNGNKYVYQSHGQKKWAKKVAELKGKGNSKKLVKAQNKLAMYKERDKARIKYANKTSLGKNVGKGIVKNLLLGGGINSGSYSRLRSSGMGRVGSTLLSGMPITSKLIENHSAKQRAMAKGQIKTYKKTKKK